MLQIPFKDVGIQEYFIYRDILYNRIKDTIRSSAHPYAVNSKQIRPYVSSRVNSRGYIALDTLVEVFTTEDIIPDVYSKIIPRTVNQITIKDSEDTQMDLQF